MEKFCNGGGAGGSTSGGDNGNNNDGDNNGGDNDGDNEDRKPNGKQKMSAKDLKVDAAIRTPASPHPPNLRSTSAPPQSSTYSASPLERVWN